MTKFSLLFKIFVVLLDTLSIKKIPGQFFINSILFAMRLLAIILSYFGSHKELIMVVCSNILNSFSRGAH